MLLRELSPFSLQFPDPETALREPNGLLAYGGDLSPDRLLSAYRQGIFPWYTPGDAILWWSPDPRAVLFPEQFHLSRSMKKFMRHTRYRVTLNQSFTEVITACANERDDGTWISDDIIEAYLYLHQSTHAHSVEVWDDGQLVGGLYGIAQGSLFCGESMFSRADNASKFALTAFLYHFVGYGGRLIDCQVLNPHTASLGATEIPRRDFLYRLAQYRTQSLGNACWQPQTLIFPPDTPSR
ncbi:leucyl/phenylalanyl-tRNA--protein transferase [Musicola paradisiaca]|uniref:Leucyl/phenylalanyl-tRNA--protein transferase n=1 Tax=Musicola paradisiaca (strain Ech703) TaxID=579405 RepID=C6C7V8_MUSP7|nr:leucyl/phenylalanyl-tRNA--protein transferase [Musicola paradisiaca]ACS86050.1 leucyl/phenylalanyl-tRNA/protein transferase [Musicola paradisiaca Ech703]